MSGPAPRIRAEDGVTVIPVLEVGQAETPATSARAGTLPWVTRIKRANCAFDQRLAAIL
jgi:hypothetical protein